MSQQEHEHRVSASEIWRWVGSERDPRQEAGWWGMACWNALSSEQQRTLIEVGVLPIGYVPEGDCENPATVCIECEDDEAPGPRFYCAGCGARYLAAKP